MTSRSNNLIVSQPEIKEMPMHITFKIPANSVNNYRYHVKMADPNIRPYHQTILLKSVERVSNCMISSSQNRILPTACISKVKSSCLGGFTYPCH